MNTVNQIVKDNLCCGCGICSAICPKNSIQLEFNGLKHAPIIDNTSCTNCGLCYKQCPGRGYSPDKYDTTDKKSLYCGNSITAYNLHNADENALLKSTSGGFVTQTVKTLLENGVYNCAFLVDGYNYENGAKTTKFDKSSEFELSRGSRYIPVNQVCAIEYMLKNPNEKIIFVGVSCFVHGLLNVIENKKLNRDNYLIIGLFCDKTMNANVFKYFEKITFPIGKIDKLYFRDKSINGAPGDVKVLSKRGRYKKLDSAERQFLKNYFVPERCLYCIDKLNQFADFSCGDNYTDIANTSLGSSSVLIRTERANKLFEIIKPLFNVTKIEDESVINAQQVYVRENNMAYAILKNSNNLQLPNVDVTPTEKQISKYKVLLNDLRLGEKWKFNSIKFIRFKNSAFINKIYKLLKRK